MARRASARLKLVELGIGIRQNVDMDSEILNRIQLLTAATGQVSRKDLQNFPAMVLASERSRFVYQDFSGGRSETEMMLLLQVLLHNLGSFLDYLIAWGYKNGVSTNSIMGYLTQSSDYCIILDLYNREKHGGRPPRDRGHSGLKPELSRPRGVLKMKTQKKKNSVVGATMGCRGEPVPIGDGTSEVIVTAEILDKNGNSLGDLDKYVEGSVRICESALRHFEVAPKC